MTDPFADDPSAAAARDALIAAGRELAARGWVPATSGNLSQALGDGRFLITASGIDKGKLGPEHVLIAPLHGDLPRGASAETALHRMIYRQDASVGAVLHTHSLAATLISRRAASAGRVRLSGYELQKAFAGITTHETTLDVPVFANTQDIAGLAETLTPAWRDWATVPGFLLASHGLYAWGRDVEAALRHLEAFDFLFRCELALAGIPA